MVPTRVLREIEIVSSELFGVSDGAVKLRLIVVGISIVFDDDFEATELAIDGAFLDTTEPAGASAAFTAVAADFVLTVLLLSPASWRRVRTLLCPEYEAPSSKAASS